MGVHHTNTPHQGQCDLHVLFDVAVHCLSLLKQLINRQLTTLDTDNLVFGVKTPLTFQFHNSVHHYYYCCCRHCDEMTYEIECVLSED